MIMNESTTGLPAGARMLPIVIAGGQFARACIIAASVAIAFRAFAHDGAPPNPDSTAPSTQPDQPKADAPSAPAFMRVQEVKNKSIELQIATRNYVQAEGKGPRVGLVGVAHIGDATFYRELQKVLDQYDIVLYESVKPSGASKPGGETAEQRIESTQSSMRFVRGMIETYNHQKDGYPANLDDVREFAAKQDPRLAQFMRDATVDAWGHDLQYGLLADAANPQHVYALISFGADGVGGGEDENADIDLGDEPAPDPLALSKEDGLQSQLAEALGLEFQLDAVDYSRPTFRCSDMDMDELNRRLAAKGLDFEVLGGTLAGSSLPGKLIKLLLGVMKLADTFMDGAITDTFKVVMIEMLGDPALTDMSMNQLGQGFGEVIINNRNEVALADLKSIIEREPQTKSVAIFYGAGHMGDFDARLREMGYAPADDGERWLTGMKVDLTQSAVSPRELNQIRAMIKQAIRQQLQAR